MSFLIQGWLLGIAFVAPIGMQNMYVINTALEKSRQRALQVALIMILFDISLSLSCFLGLGAILNGLPSLRAVLLGVGSLAVIYIGVTLLKSKPTEEKSQDLEKSILQIVASCFVVTWLNPQAIIDGTLLLAGFRATIHGVDANYFIIGVCMASIMWFIGLSTLIATFKDAFTGKVIRMINILCGSIIIFFGLKLLGGFISGYLIQ